jgi:hypothetical protein
MSCNSYHPVFFVLQCNTKQSAHEEVQRVNIITSPYEFMKVWQALRGTTDVSAHAQVLRAVQPVDLRTGEYSFLFILNLQSIWPKI